MVDTVGKTLATQTCNIDVHSICRRYSRIMLEWQKAQSSGVSQQMPFDTTRARSYLASANSFLDYIVSEPLLDMPETGPVYMDLPPKPAQINMENDSLWDCVNLLSAAWDELANSASSRLPTNLIKFDFERQKSYLRKISNLLDYVAAAEPLDLPESSPSQLMTGSGQRGI